MLCTVRVRSVYPCDVASQEFEQQMADIFNLAEETSEAHRIARWMILGYLFVLMFKFFKAFRRWAEELSFA